MSNAITCPKQRPLNDACSMYKHMRLWTSSPAQSGPLAPWIHFLTPRLHQDTHTTYAVKITSSVLCVVSATRKELLLCWLIALSRYFLPAPAVWLHALPRASASSSEKKMSCRSLPTIEWKQAFDQRPRRARKGTNGFRRTRRGGTCHEVWNTAPTAIRLLWSLVLGKVRGVFVVLGH